MSDDEVQEKLVELINKCRLCTNKNAPGFNPAHLKKQQTHTILGGHTRGTFCIEDNDDNDYNNFIKFYKLLYSAYDFYFVERPLPVTYLLVDIDWWYKKGYLKREYTLKKHICKIIKIINNCMLQYFNVEKTNLLSFVHEKPKPTIVPKGKDEYAKDGFHVFYPYIPLMFHHRHFVLQKLEEEMSIQEIFSDIHYQPESNSKGVKTGTELHGIVDHSIVMNNGILMHGSHKEGGLPYKVTHVFNHHMGECDIDEYVDNDICDLLLNRRFEIDDNILPKDDLSNEELLELKKKSMMHLGPSEKELWKKMNTDVQDVQDVQDVENDENDNNNNEEDEYDGNDHSTYDKHERHKKELYENENENENEVLPGLKSDELMNSHIQSERDIYIAAKLCKLLSKKRASGYDSWLNVCFALHNISPLLFEVFNEFSKKTTKSNYSRDECKKKWEECRPNRYTLNSIYKWAREDSTSEQYSKTIDEIISPIIKKAMSGTHDDIANMVHTIYRDRYKCVSLKNDVWFEFQGHKWVETQSAYTFMENISGHASN